MNKINNGRCRTCGGLVLLGEIMGLRTCADTEPLDDQTAASRLLGGQELLLVYRDASGTPLRLSGAPAGLLARRPENAIVVTAHSGKAPDGAKLNCGPWSASPLRPVVQPVASPCTGREEGCNSRACAGCDEPGF
jgi:hypothetical protein